MITCILHAEVGGLADRRVILRDGVVEEVSSAGWAPPTAHVLDARGGAVIRGIHDHHVHMRSAAARRRSVEVGDVRSHAGLAAKVRSRRRGGEPLRLLGYDSDQLGQLTLADLESLLPDAPPIRVQHRSGHHSVLNAAARRLALAGGSQVGPDGIIWDDDKAVSALPPLITTADVAAEFQRMRGRGIVAVSDLTVTNTAADAATLRSASGSVAVRAFGTASAARAGDVDGVKILVHDHTGISPDEIAEEMSSAPEAPVALHVVTDAALALALAACGEHGGDREIRFEHAFICSPDAVHALAASGASVGAHPGFMVTQGDRLARALTGRERASYQPLRSLADAGVPLYGGTDAPFGGSDPWVAMQSAVDRHTPDGSVLADQEALTPEEAFALFSRDGLRGEATTPTLAEGDSGICVLDRPWTIARSALGNTGVVETVGG